MAREYPIKHRDLSLIHRNFNLKLNQAMIMETLVISLLPLLSDIDLRHKQFISL